MKALIGHGIFLDFCCVRALMWQKIGDQIISFTYIIVFSLTDGPIKGNIIYVPEKYG